MVLFDNLPLFLIVVVKLSSITSETITVSINDVESEAIYTEESFTIEKHIYDASLNSSAPYPPPRVCYYLFLYLLTIVYSVINV